MGISHTKRHFYCILEEREQRKSFDINSYSFRTRALSLQYIFRKREFHKSFFNMHIHTFYIPSLDCDISTLNLHFYRSLNFIRYSNVSACDAAPRGGSTCNNKTPAMFCAKKAI